VQQFIQFREIGKSFRKRADIYFETFLVTRNFDALHIRYEGKSVFQIWDFAVAR